MDENVSFSVLNYINTDATAFQTKTITCDAVRGEEGKVWKRVYVMTTANFHRIRIENEDSATRPRIHAIVPYFEEVRGRMI